MYYKFQVQVHCTYGAVNLAGGSNYVTGTLPTGNQANQSLGGDLSGTTNSATVIKIQGNPVINTSLGSTQDGYVLTWHNASTQAQWLPVSGGGGGSVTWANDLVNSTSTNQYVSSLSYSSSSAGGTIAINGTGTALQVAANNTAFSISQATQTSNTQPVNIKLQPQAPYASATGDAQYPGNIEIDIPAPTGGLSTWGSLSSATAGNLIFKSNTTLIGGIGIATVNNYGTIDGKEMAIWFGSATKGQGFYCKLKYIFKFARIQLQFEFCEWRKFSLFFFR